MARSRVDGKSSTVQDIPLRPPLKWVDGKRWLVPVLRELWQGHVTCHLVEPFVSGMAVALGVFFDEDWQAYSREVLQKDDLVDLYNRTFGKINLASARNIARPQIDRLKSLLEDSIAPEEET